MRRRNFYLLLGVVVAITALWVLALLIGPLPSDAGTFAAAESEIVTNVDGPWYTVGAAPLLLSVIFVGLPASIIYVFFAQYAGLWRFEQ